MSCHGHLYIFTFILSKKHVKRFYCSVLDSAAQVRTSCNRSWCNKIEKQENLTPLLNAGTIGYSNKGLSLTWLLVHAGTIGCSNKGLSLTWLLVYAGTIGYSNKGLSLTWLLVHAGTIGCSNKGLSLTWLLVHAGTIGYSNKGLSMTVLLHAGTVQ